MRSCDAPAPAASVTAEPPLRWSEPRVPTCVAPHPSPQSVTSSPPAHDTMVRHGAGRALATVAAAVATAVERSKGLAGAVTPSAGSLSGAESTASGPVDGLPPPASPVRFRAPPPLGKRLAAAASMYGCGRRRWRRQGGTWSAAASGPYRAFTPVWNGPRGERTGLMAENTGRHAGASNGVGDGRDGNEPRLDHGALVFSSVQASRSCRPLVRN